MGLDISHDAWHGAYSAFNRFRQKVAQAMGGSYPPHYIYDKIGYRLYEGADPDLPIINKELDGNTWYWGDGFNQ